MVLLYHCLEWNLTGSLRITGCEQEVTSGCLKWLGCMIIKSPFLQDFELTLATLAHIGAVVVEAGAITVKKSTNKTTAFLSQMFEPFLLGYWVWCSLYSLVLLDCDAVACPTLHTSYRFSFLFSFSINAYSCQCILIKLFEQMTKKDMW